MLEEALPYVGTILNTTDDRLPRLECAAPSAERYNRLVDPVANDNQLPTYLFALDLHQARNVTPSLLGAVVEAIKFLGYQNCALSIVEGRSTDGTLEILSALQDALKGTGLSYTLRTSDINPLAEAVSRIESLATLRNIALEPFTLQPDRVHADATIIFVNDIILCPDDILEIIYQHRNQAADMVCAMDWEILWKDPTFYDVWIARGMTGDSFFNIPEDGNWNSAWNLFWNDHDARARLNSGLPFQVFSCWNGITAFTAKLLLSKEISFRGPIGSECYQGEPKLFCKDLWSHGHGKIAVIPSVNVAYTLDEAKAVKDLKGYVSKWATAENDGNKINWQAEPPAEVKCMPTYDHQVFLPWNQGAEG